MSWGIAGVGARRAAAPGSRRLGREPWRSGRPRSRSRSANRLVGNVARLRRRSRPSGGLRCECRRADRWSRSPVAVADVDVRRRPAGRMGERRWCCRPARRAAHRAADATAPGRTSPSAAVLAVDGTGADRRATAATCRRRRPGRHGASTARDRDARLWPGPRLDWFVDDAWRRCCSSAVRRRRRQQPGRRAPARARRCERSRAGELPSEGLVEGAVQVPPDGQPIVMLADHPITGGYPVIAVVDPADLRHVAQAAPARRSGSDRSRLSRSPRRCSARATSRATVARMERRIFGLENEYGVTCTLRGQRRLSPDEVARYLFRRVVSWGRSSNVFLQNGARLYLDVGSHPEYATPECDSLYDLVVHDKAGERILESLLRLGRAAPPRGGHPRHRLPVQEQHRLGRQQLRLPRELLHQPQRRPRPLRRGADPVPRQPADLHRRRQGAADRTRSAVLDGAARRAHLGGRQSAPRPAAGRSSTPATSRTPTPRSTAGCTSSSATRT